MKLTGRRIAGGLALVLAAAALAFLLWPRPPRLYQATILPSLGGNRAIAYGINDRGQVAGVARVAGVSPVPGRSRFAAAADHLFLWDRETGIQDLGPVVDDLVLINDAGQIVGTMRDPNGHNRAFIWDPNSGRRLLPTLGGDNGEPWAMNNRGQVVGHADTDSGHRHAFVWDVIQGIRNLTPSTTKPARAFAINDAGLVLTFDGNGPLLISTRDDQVTPPARPALRGAFDINSAGTVVGLSSRVNDKVDVELWHPNSGSRKVGPLKGGHPGTPRINDAGQVFFWQRRRAKFELFELDILVTPDAHYLWDAQRGTIALDACVPLGRGDRLRLIDLNNHGALVGVVHRRNGRSEAVLLEPIPERWGAVE